MANTSHLYRKQNVQKEMHTFLFYYILGAFRLVKPIFISIFFSLFFIGPSPCFYSEYRLIQIDCSDDNQSKTITMPGSKKPPKRPMRHVNHQFSLEFLLIFFLLFPSPSLVIIFRNFFSPT